MFKQKLRIHELEITNQVLMREIKRLEERLESVEQIRKEERENHNRQINQLFSQLQTPSSSRGNITEYLDHLNDEEEDNDEGNVKAIQAWKTWEEMFLGPSIFIDDKPLDGLLENENAKTEN